MRLLFQKKNAIRAGWRLWIVNPAFFCPRRINPSGVSVLLLAFNFRLGHFDFAKRASPASSRLAPPSGAFWQPYILFKG
jgi:hypothetical protein